MLKILVFALFSQIACAYMVHLESNASNYDLLSTSEYEPSINLRDSSKLNINPNDLSYDTALFVLEEFTDQLYFGSEEEKGGFRVLFKEKLSMFFGKKTQLQKGFLVEEYYQQRVKVNLIASDTMSIYNQLRQCQLKNSLSIDPLSNILSSVITASTPYFDYYDLQGVYRYFIYGFYQEYLIYESQKIYSKRLAECNSYFYYQNIATGDDDGFEIDTQLLNQDNKSQSAAVLN